MLAFFSACLTSSNNLPCPREQPAQVLMATQSVSSKLTKVVLDITSSRLLGVLIPADIHRLPCDLEREKKKKKRTGHVKYN